MKEILNTEVKISSVYLVWFWTHLYLSQSDGKNSKHPQHPQTKHNEHP